MRKNIIDLTRILRGYKDLWVALNRTQDRVVASGNTLAEALERRARREGHERPLIFGRQKIMVGECAPHPDEKKMSERFSAGTLG